MCDSPKKPAKASMATRPCFSSASLYLMNSLSVSGQRERGSKNPNGAVTPASPFGSNTVVKRETCSGMCDDVHVRRNVMIILE